MLSDGSKLQRKTNELSMSNRGLDDSQANLMTQSELFRSYSEQNHLYLNMTTNMLWFEFGGNKIARLQIEG